jgi:hypothetical protein
MTVSNSSRWGSLNPPLVGEEVAPKKAKRGKAVPNPLLQNRRAMMKQFVEELSDEELELLPISIQAAIDSMVQTCEEQWSPSLFIDHYFRLRRFMEVSSL